MEKSFREEILHFVSANNLAKPNGILLFDAVVFYYSNYVAQSINTPVQIVNLPNASAIYIFEFFKDEYQHPEMYSTDEYDFQCNASFELEIRKKISKPGFLISIKPFTRIINTVD